MRSGRAIRFLMAVVFVVVSACSEPRPERLLTSRTTGPPQRHVELIDDQPTLPDTPGDRGLAVLSTSFNALTEHWDRFHMSGDPPDTNMHEGAVLMVGFGESGTCPLRYGGILFEDRLIRINEKPREEIENMDPDVLYGCTLDFRFRTLVFALPESRVPKDKVTVLVEGGHGRFPLERH